MILKKTSFVNDTDFLDSKQITSTVKGLRIESGLHHFTRGVPSLKSNRWYRKWFQCIFPRADSMETNM